MNSSVNTSAGGLPDEHMHYAKRGYGMDQDRYPWSMLGERKPVHWPGDARIALWIIPALEWFPLNMKGVPFKPPGAMQTSYPDLRHYTLRDYGNRVGIHRIMQVLDTRGLKASVAVNAAVARRYPALIKECTRRGWEVIANGLDMDHLHHSGLSLEAEKQLIEQTLSILRDASAQPVRGWLSPAKSESFHTPDLVAEAGIDYLCDWVNDDLPYAFKTASRAIHAMPHPIDIDDHTILVQNHHSEDDFRDALIDQFNWLYREAGQSGGRVMAISLHPWIIGQPYRIRALEEALDHMLRHAGVWSATGAEILDAWKRQQG